MKNEERAELVAQKVHANQSYDIYPYMYHVKQVVNVAKELGYDEEIIIGCYLHDSMEDGNLSYNDIKKAFGKNVAEIVFAVTDELGRNRTERKEKTYPKIKANWKATVVKLCDRIANVRQSRKYNEELFAMYIKECSDFEANIKSKSHPEDVEKAWDLLESTYSNQPIVK